VRYPPKQCKRCGTTFEPKRPHAQFCSSHCRVYWHLYDQYDEPRATIKQEHDQADASIGAAVKAARAFTVVAIPDHKTVAAITVDRKSPDPATWSVKVPPGSMLAAGKIHQDLLAHIGDLVTLANKISTETGEPRLVLQTRAAAKRR
jgi:hypothetical protein